MRKRKKTRVGLEVPADGESEQRIRFIVRREVTFHTECERRMQVAEGDRAADAAVESEPGTVSA